MAEKLSKKMLKSLIFASISLTFWPTLYSFLRNWSNALQPSGAPEKIKTEPGNGPTGKRMTVIHGRFNVPKSFGNVLKATNSTKQSEDCDSQTGKTKQNTIIFYSAELTSRVMVRGQTLIAFRMHPLWSWHLSSNVFIKTCWAIM